MNFVEFINHHQEFSSIQANICMNPDVLMLESKLRDLQRKAIFRAVCRHCFPRGCNGNLFKFAKQFADNAVNEISPYDKYYEISFYYTKNRCPFVVEFKI